MFPTAGPLGFPIGTASRMLVVKVDLRLKRSMSASGTFETAVQHQECLLIGVNPKASVDGQHDAIDPCVIGCNQQAGRSVLNSVSSDRNPAPRSFVLTLIKSENKIVRSGWHLLSWNLEGDSHESIVTLRCGSSCRDHVDSTH
jgi:hypothetical protein